MSGIILGDEKCRCLTSFEMYTILGSLQEGDIKRTKERRKIDMLKQVKRDIQTKRKS